MDAEANSMGLLLRRQILGSLMSKTSCSFVSFFLIFLKDSIVFLPTHFPSIKAEENKVGEGIRVKKKAFPLGWRWERNRKANSTLGCSSGAELVQHVQDPGLPLQHVQSTAREVTPTHLQASVMTTYEDGALASLVFLLPSFACIPLFRIYVCLAPLWPDRELPLLLFHRTWWHIAAKRVET